MLLTLNASTVKTATGLQAIAESAGFQVTLDEGEALGGTNTGMSPAEMTLCALGGCLSILTSMITAKMRLAIDEFRVDTEGEVDTDGFSGVKGVRPGFQQIRYTFRFKTSEPEKKIEKLVNMVEGLCPIHDTLSHPVDVVRKGIVIE